MADDRTRDNRPHDQDYYDRANTDDRGFIERAGDEVRSWLGDDEAEYRRERYDRDPRNRGERDRGDRHPGAVSRMAYGSEHREDRGVEARPLTGRYRGGRGGRQRWGRAAYGGSNPGRDPFATSGEGARRHDEEHGHYRSWRDEQVARLDRDYDEYRREREDQFHSEFDQWRTRRGEQRGAMRQARGGMEVVGREGEHLGTVERVTGDRILLAGDDAESGGHRHSIPVAWIDRVDDKVTIEKTSDEAQQAWRREADRSSLFTGSNNEDEVRWRSGLDTAQTMGGDTPQG